MGNDRMLVVYWRGLHALYRHSAALVSKAHDASSRSTIVAVRQFSSSSASGGRSNNPITKKTTSVQEQHNNPHDAAALVQPPTPEVGMPWLNIRAGILGPRDSRLTLPGGVGISLQPVTTVDAETQVLTPLPPHTSSLRFLDTFATNYQSQIQAMFSIQKNTEEESQAEMESLLECKAQECPKLLQKDLRSLFPSWPAPEAGLTAVTLAQRTDNDMAAWNESVEEEREVLLKQFVDAARQICSSLNAEGYWADFMDPTSGRPYFAPYTTATMFETDDRYRFLGLTIEDLGCCKVISHKIFGTHVFVGVIFTDAPTSCAALRNVLDWHKSQAATTTSPPQ